MSQQIADFYAKISADASSLIEEAKKSQQQMDALSAKLKEAGVSQAAYNKALAGAKQEFLEQNKAAEKSVGVFGALKDKITSVVNPTTLMMAAVTGLAVYLKNATAAAAESAQVDAKLNAVLHATGNAAGLTSGELDSMASSLSKMSGVDDEVIKSAEAVMLTFREIGGNVFPQAMQAALDMSAVMGQDLQSSVVQISKALNDPIAGVTALRKVGIQLTDQQREQIKVFMEAGDVASAQGVILQELAMEFGGASQSMNDAGDGSANLKTSLGNLQEAIGGSLLPSTRAFKNSLSELIDKMTDGVNAGSNFQNTLEIGNRLMLLYGGSLALVNSSVKINAERVEEAGNEYKRAEQYGLAWESALEKTSSATAAAAMTTEQFNQKINTLAGYMSTDLTDAQASYNEKIAEYKKELADARTEEDRQGIQDRIDAETEAYNRRAASIIFNIQQEALLAAAQNPEQQAAVLPVLTQLAESYGLIDENQSRVMNSTNNLVALWSSGAITLEQLTAGLSNMGRSAMVTSGAEQDLSNKIYNVSQKSQDAADVLPKFEEEQAKLGQGIRENSLPAVKGLANTLSGMPLTGTSWSYTFNIVTHGSVPRIPKRGSNTGSGAGYDNNAGVDSEFGTNGGGNYGNSGGQWNGGWLIVGDAPGGRMTPFTEAISPSGYVYNAEETKVLKNAGVLDGATSLARGSGYMGSADTIDRTTKRSMGSGYATSIRPQELSLHTTTTSIPTYSDSSIVSEVTGAQSAMQDTIMLALNRQASNQAVQNDKISLQLSELIAVMLSGNPRAIGDEVGFQLAKRL